MEENSIFPKSYPSDIFHKNPKEAETLEKNPEELPEIVKDA